MAIADMFLKIQGVTGEASDADHQGEIQISSWSWGMQASVSAAAGASSPLTGRTTIHEVQIVKSVDLSSPTLMLFLNNHKLIAQARLTVRKAGKTPLEYLTIELEKVRITSYRSESLGADLVEHVNLGFSKARVTYTPQDPTGAKGGGANMFEIDLEAH